MTTIIPFPGIQHGATSEPILCLDADGDRRINSRKTLWNIWKKDGFSPHSIALLFARNERYRALFGCPELSSGQEFPIQ